MRQMRLLPVLTAVAASLAAWGTVGAYTTSGYKWATNQVQYFVNPANKYVSPADAVAALQRAADAWSQSNANVQLVYAGYTSGTSLTANRKNEIFFRDDVSSSIAEAYWWWDGTGSLIDADIVFHQNYKFFVNGGACSGGFYIENTGTHEFGHVLGLRHSSISVATMWPNSGTCETIRQTLDVDDMAGVEFLYPPAGSAEPPAAPSSLRATTNTANPTSSILLSWRDNAGNESGFRVERSANGGTFAQIAQLGVNSQAYTDGGLTSGTTYSYRVAAFNADGSAYSGVASAQTQSASSPSGVSLTVRAYKVKGIQKADLTWSGLSATNTDVYRSGVRVAMTTNDGSYTDSTNKKGSASYSYRICGTGTTSCSNTVTVVF
jgi:Matrixin